LLDKFWIFPTIIIEERKLSRLKNLSWLNLLDIDYIIVHFYDYLRLIAICYDIGIDKKLIPHSIKISLHSSLHDVLFNSFFSFYLILYSNSFLNYLIVPCLLMLHVLIMLLL